MKLSDIKGERTFDVIADLIEPITTIAADPNAEELFSRRKPPDGENPKAFLLKRIGKCAPALLRDHKGRLAVILSTLDGCTIVEYLESLSLGKLIKDIYSLVTDDFLMDFFI